MLQLTSVERAMRERLLAIAASHTPEKITYEELWVAATGSDFRESGGFRLMGRMLYHIATYEQRLGRPMLTALVVKASGLPGDGFFELAEQFGRDVSDNDQMWSQELERVREFWSRALDPSAVVRDRHGPMLAWDPTVLGDTRALATFDEIKRRL